MDVATIPMDTLVPISRFGRGGAAKEFEKVRDGVPVTVLKNSVPTYFILNAHDYREVCALRRKLESAEARADAESGTGKTFKSIDALMADLDD